VLTRPWLAYCATTIPAGAPMVDQWMNDLSLVYAGPGAKDAEGDRPQSIDRFIAEQTISRQQEQLVVESLETVQER